MNNLSKLTVLVGAVLMSTSLMAQDFNYGVQGGANFAVQSSIGDIYDNDDIRSGFSAGAFVNYSFTEKFSLQTEINYDQKGSKYDNIENNYDYLSIPILASYELHKGNKTPWSLDFNVGPYASFLLSAETDFSNPELGTIDQVDNTNSAEFGMQAGFTVRYPINNQNVLLNLKYGMGLTAYDKDDSDPKNKFFGIGIGYEF